MLYALRRNDALINIVDKLQALSSLHRHTEQLASITVDQRRAWIGSIRGVDWVGSN